MPTFGLTDNGDGGGAAAVDDGNGRARECADCKTNFEGFSVRS